MPYNVLIVDDMLVNRRLIRSVLKKVEDLSFFEASNGQEALNIVLSQDIDLVILDLLMPVMDGFTLLKEMKQELGLGIPVIVNSGSDQADALQRALELGAYDYFPKPLSTEQMHVVLPLKVKNAIMSFDQNKKLQLLNTKLEEEMQLAAVLQRTLMEHSCEGCFVDIFKFYQPSVYLAGDLILAERIDDTIWVLSADVCGHGVASALLASMQKALFSHLIRAHKEPAQVLSAMNRELNRLFGGEYYFTALLGRIEERKLTYVNAGHPPPLLLRHGAGAITLKQRGFPVGMMEEVEYETGTFQLAAGDMLLTYTDGFISNLVFNEHFPTSQAVLDHLIASFGTDHIDLDVAKQTLLDLARQPLREDFKDDVALMLLTVE